MNRFTCRSQSPPGLKKAELLAKIEELQKSQALTHPLPVPLTASTSTPVPATPVVTEISKEDEKEEEIVRSRRGSKRRTAVIESLEEEPMLNNEETSLDTSSTAPTASASDVPTPVAAVAEQQTVPLSEDLDQLTVVELKLRAERANIVHKGCTSGYFGQFRAHDTNRAQEG